MGVEIDRKLCLTAALVGAASRKDLAAAFRRVNPVMQGHPQDPCRSRSSNPLLSSGARCRPRVPTEPRRPL